jgi:hypothetical protein
METTFNVRQPRELFWINAAPLRTQPPASRPVVGTLHAHRCDRHLPQVGLDALSMDDVVLTSQS